MRILILQPNLLGDAIVATPLLRQIRNALPQTHVSLLLGPLNIGIQPLLRHLVHEVVPYAKNPLNLFKLFVHGRLARYDYLIDLALDPLKVSRALVPLIGAKTKIGLDNGNGQLYDIVVRGPREAPVADRYLSLLGPLGVAQPADPRIELIVPEEVNEWARQNWPVALDRPTVLINIRGSGFDKFWGVDRYAQWIEAVRATHPALQFVIVGHRQEEDVQRIAELAKIPPLPRTPQFVHVAACVKQADYVLSPDTGIIHLAAAFQKPCLGLYRTRAGDHNWIPYHSPSVNLKSPTLNVFDIPVADAIDGFERLLTIAATANR